MQKRKSIERNGQLQKRVAGLTFLEKLSANHPEKRDYSTLLEYMKSPEGQKGLEKLASDREMLTTYMEYMSDKDVGRHLVGVMKSRQFEPFFDCLTGCDSGVRVISQASQYPEVRIFSMRLLGNPANYSSILRALRRVARSDPTEHTRCRLPSINLCVVNGKFKEILNDPDAGSKLFSSLSETEYNAKICKRILQTDELRRALFDFITKNPEKCMEMFRKIFADFGRRNRCVDIFASPGGTKLLVDLAGDPVGKGMITALSIIPYGIEIGKRLFARNPLMVIKVGKAYLKKPEKE